MGDLINDEQMADTLMAASIDGNGIETTLLFLMTLCLHHGRPRTAEVAYAALQCIESPTSNLMCAALSGDACMMGQIGPMQ